MILFLLKKGKIPSHNIKKICEVNILNSICITIYLNHFWVTYGYIRSKNDANNGVKSILEHIKHIFFHTGYHVFKATNMYMYLNYI